MARRYEITRLWLLLIIIGAGLAGCDQKAKPEEESAPQMTVEARPTSPPPTDAPPTSTSIPATITPIPATITPTRADVTVIEDVEYARAIDPAADDQSLDIYVPGEPGHFPAIIWAHGSDQDKSTGMTVGRVLARQGFVVLAIDWQDGSNDDDYLRALREATEDGECVLRFIADQAEEYGADPEKAIWAGFSAGSYLGSLLSFSEGDIQEIWKAYAAENDGRPARQVQCSVEPEPAEIIGFVANSGPFPEELWFEDAENQDLSEPLELLRESVAIGNNPTLQVRLIHGVRDRTTPLEDAERFFNALEEAGYDVVFFKEQGGHEPFFQQVMDQIMGLVGE